VRAKRQPRLQGLLRCLDCGAGRAAGVHAWTGESRHLGGFL